MRILLFIFCFLLGAAQAQVINTDSLIKVYEKNPKDEGAISTVDTLVRTYLDLELSDSVHNWSNKLVSLAYSHDDLEGMAKGNLYQAYAYSKQGKLESAVIAAKESLKLRLRNKSSASKISSCYICLGNTYQKKGMMPEGLQYYQKALDTLISVGNYKDAVTPMINAGNMYLVLNDLVQAKKYYLEAETLAEKEGVEGRDLADVLNGIGNYYFQSAKYDSMMDYYRKALDLFLEVNYKTGIANTYNNLAIGYFYLENPDGALEYFTKGLQVRRLNKDSIGEAQSLNNIGLYYHGMEDYPTAIEFFKESMDLSVKIDATRETYDAAEALYETYELLGDYKNAFTYRDCTFILRTQIEEENHQRSVEDLEVKYGAKKKDDAISQLNQLRLKDAEIKAEEDFASNVVTISISLIAIILAAFGVVLLMGNKRKKKANELLQAQKTEIEKNRDQIEQQNVDITDSIKYAQRIQDAILPDQSEFENLGEHFLMYLPRDIVSGDFYWYFKKGDEQFIAIADCTGHGVPGAFVSMLCHNSISEVVIEKGVTDPGKILSLVNQEVLQRLSNKQEKVQINDGMDVILCRFNKKLNKLSYAGAFNSLLRLRNAEVDEFSVDRESIGGATSFDYEFETHEVELNSGDVFYLRTDGYQDQFGGTKGKKMMKRRMIELLKTAGSKPLPQQNSFLQEELIKWMGDYKQVDDITMLGFKVD